jgi:hypothetical protein
VETTPALPVPVKRGVGRPKSAKLPGPPTKFQLRQARIAQGQAMDQKLAVDVPVLEQHVRSHYAGDQNHVHTNAKGETRSDRNDGYWFIQYGAGVLRDIAYQKQPRPKDQDVLDDDSSYPYEDKKFADSFIDASCDLMLDIAHRIHLSEPLVQFEIECFTAAVRWMELHPEANAGLQEIKSELEARLQGIDTFQKKRMKPGPKPNPLAHSGRSFVTSEDILRDRDSEDS